MFSFEDYKIKEQDLKLNKKSVTEKASEYLIKMKTKPIIPKH